MKLLFDQNLSYLLVAQLQTVFPDSSHVRLLGLESASDREVWNFAREKGYTIITQDSDFNDLSGFLGVPPKVIWLRCGNMQTNRVKSLLLKRAEQIESFVENPEMACLEIY